MTPPQNASLNNNTGSEGAERSVVLKAKYNRILKLETGTFIN